MIAKSIIDVTKGIRTNTRTVSISGIVSQNDNFNNKAFDVNDELAKMCREAKLRLRQIANKDRGKKSYS